MNSYCRTSGLYVLELSGAMALFVGALFARQPLLDHVGQTGPLAQAIMLSPIPGLCLVFLAIYRYYRRVDEYQRLALLQAVSFAAGVSAVFFSSYGFLQDAFGLKPLSIEWAWPVLAVVWGLCTAYVSWRGKAGQE